MGNMNDQELDAWIARCNAENEAAEKALAAAREGKISPQKDKATWIKLRQAKRIAEVKADKPSKYGHGRKQSLSPEKLEALRLYCWRFRVKGNRARMEALAAEYGIAYSTLCRHLRAFEKTDKPPVGTYVPRDRGK